MNPTRSETDRARPTASCALRGAEPQVGHVSAPAVEGRAASSSSIRPAASAEPQVSRHPRRRIECWSSIRPAPAVEPQVDRHLRRRTTARTSIIAGLDPQVAARHWDGPASCGSTAGAGRMHGQHAARQPQYTYVAARHPLDRQVAARHRYTPATCRPARPHRPQSRTSRWPYRGDRTRPHASGGSYGTATSPRSAFSAMSVRWCEPLRSIFATPS
jgi:hypothetical protein